jgi:hypothetical protein
MHSENQPVTSDKRIPERSFVNHIRRCSKSHFTRDLIVILAVAGYIVGLCYFCTFLLAHPLLLALFIIGAALLAVAWVAGGAQ